MCGMNLQKSKNEMNNEGRLALDYQFEAICSPRIHTAMAGSCQSVANATNQRKIRRGASFRGL